MSPTKLRDWLEIVGIFSVVASLLFVGLQMRQAHEISLSQAYQARTTAASEYNVAFAANPAALSGYRKAIEGAEEDITPEEFQSLRRIIISAIYLYDNAHYQYQNGFVSEDFWLVTRNNLRDFMSNPVIKAIVDDRMYFQGRPEFRAVLQSIDDELRARSDSSSSE